MNKGKSISLVIGVFFLFNFVSCIKNNTRETAPVSTACSGTAGPKFLAVKNLIAANCVSCHNNIIANGGQNFTIECNIVANHSLIKFKAVEEGSMPPTGPLSQADKNSITNWVNAGGRYTD